MPVYQYQCQTCQHYQQEEHAQQDEPLIACNACGGLMEKVLTKAPLVIQASQKSADKDSNSDHGLGEKNHQCHTGCALHRPYSKPLQAEDNTLKNI